MASSLKKSLPNVGVLIAVVFSVAALGIVIYKETRTKPTQLSTAEGNFTTDKNFLLYEHEKRVRDFENRLDKLETRLNRLSDLKMKTLDQMLEKALVDRYTKITPEGTLVSIQWDGPSFLIPKSIRDQFDSLEIGQDFVALSSNEGNGGFLSVNVSLVNEGFTQKQDPQLADCPAAQYSPELRRAAKIVMGYSTTTPIEVCRSIREVAYESQDLAGCFKKPKEEWLPKMYAYRSPTQIEYIVDPNVASYTRPEMVIGIHGSSEKVIDEMIKSFESTAKIYSTLAFSCAG